MLYSTLIFSTLLYSFSSPLRFFPPFLLLSSLPSLHSSSSLRSPPPCPRSSLLGNHYNSQSLFQLECLALSHFTITTFIQGRMVTIEPLIANLGVVFKALGSTGSTVLVTNQAPITAGKKSKQLKKLKGGRYRESNRMNLTGLDWTGEKERRREGRKGTGKGRECRVGGSTRKLVEERGTNRRNKRPKEEEENEEERGS